MSKSTKTSPSIALPPGILCGTALRVSDAARAGAGQLAAPPPAAIRGNGRAGRPAQSMLMNTGSIIWYESWEPARQGSAAGWLADKIGRRVGFIAPLIWGAVFMTLWVYAASNLWLWVFGLAWGFGFLGFWGPSTTLTAEVFPTRIRGVANGVVWFIGYFVGFVLWPFATVAVQQATGSFAVAFLTIPVFMAAMAVGVWFIVPEHAGKELNAIAV